MPSRSSEVETNWPVPVRSRWKSAAEIPAAAARPAL